MHKNTLQKFFHSLTQLLHVSSTVYLFPPIFIFTSPHDLCSLKCLGPLLSFFKAHDDCSAPMILVRSQPTINIILSLVSQTLIISFSFHPPFDMSHFHKFPLSSTSVQYWIYFFIKDFLFGFLVHIVQLQYREPGLAGPELASSCSCSMQPAVFCIFMGA